MVGRKSVEMEKETLMERLEASKRVVEAARRESLCLEKQVKGLEGKLQSSQGEAQAAEEKLLLFLERMAGLLQGTSDNVILPTEQDVLHKVDKLCNKVSADICVHVSQRHSCIKTNNLTTFLGGSVCQRWRPGCDASPSS